MVRDTMTRARTRLRGMSESAYTRISAPIPGLHQAAYLLAGLTLASQLLALLRDRTFAHTFGAGEVLDMYYAAFRVPDLVFAIVASLVSAYVLIPRISNLGRDETRALLSQTASFLFIGGSVICVSLAIWMPQFLTFLYPDLITSTLRADFILLGRMLLVQPILLGLSSVYSSVTQVHRRFFLFALSPVLYNIGIIAGTVYLYPRFGLPGIGIGVLVGALAYLSVHIPVLIVEGVMPRLTMPKFSVLAPIVRDSVPRSLALGMNSIIALILTAIASRMSSGSVSVFTFASNLEAVPLALIGSSYAVATFPALSEVSSPEKKKEFTRILSASSRHVILWSLVALGLIVVLRAHIVRVVLGTGAFDWNATRMTAALLALLTVGLAADALKLLFSRALYAARQSWRPLIYQVAAGALTVFLAVQFLALPPETMLAPLADLLKVSDVSETAVLMLALATAIGQIFLVILSLLALRSVAPGLTRTLVQPLRDGVLAALVGGFVAHFALELMGGIAPLTTLAAVFFEGLIGGILGLCGAAITLHVLSNPEFAVIVGVVKRFMSTPRDAAEVLEPSAEDPMHS